MSKKIVNNSSPYIVWAANTLCSAMKKSSVFRCAFMVACQHLWQSCTCFPFLFSFRAYFHSFSWNNYNFIYQSVSFPNESYSHRVLSVQGNYSLPPHDMDDRCVQEWTLRILGMNFEFQVSFCETYKNGFIAYKKYTTLSNNTLKRYSKSLHFR